MITYVLSLITCILDVLHARLDDTDAKPDYYTTSVVVETYGQLVAAVIYSAVEIVACLHFVIFHKLQATRQHLLPIVRRRSLATLRNAFIWTLNRSALVLTKISLTRGGALIGRLVRPGYEVFKGCQSDLRLLFGDDCFSVAGDYLWMLFERGCASLSTCLGKILDYIAAKAHRSTFLWIIYMPIAIWFSIYLCALSVCLAFIAPFTSSPEPAAQPSPRLSRVVAAQSLHLDHITPDISKLTASAAPAEPYISSFTSSAFLSTSSSVSVCRPPAIEESPSLDLSKILADMDPRAEVSTLINLEMHFVPEIYVTHADESAIFCVADLPLSPDSLEYIANADDDTPFSGLSESYFPRDAATFEGITRFLDDRASQDDILPPVEATPSASTATTATAVMVTDTCVEEAREDIGGQVGNAEALTDSDGEILARLMAHLDGRDAEGAFRPYLDCPLRRAPAASAAPPHPSAPAAAAHEAVDIFDRFTDCQALPVAPAGSRLYAMYEPESEEVAIGADDALSSAVSAACKPPTPTRPGASSVPQRQTEGAENRPPPPEYWSRARGGPIPIVAPPPSRRRRSAPVLGPALATGDKRKDYLIRRALS